MMAETSTTDTQRIEDAGQIVPYARKHMAQATGDRVSGAIRLASLIQEPDWAQVSQLLQNAKR